MLLLPKSLFEETNLMIEQGKPYAEIIRSGDLDLYNITLNILSDWVTSGGHAEWLEQQHHDAELHHGFQSFLDLTLKRSGNQLHEVGFQLAAFQLCKVLADFDPAVLRQKLQDDPKTLLELLKVLPKFSEAEITCENHRVHMLDAWRWEDRRARDAKRERKLELIEECKREQEELAAERRLAAAKQAQAQQAQPPNPPLAAPAAQPSPPNPQQT